MKDKNNLTLYHVYVIQNQCMLSKELDLNNESEVYKYSVLAEKSKEPLSMEDRLPIMGDVVITDSRETIKLKYTLSIINIGERV